MDGYMDGRKDRWTGDTWGKCEWTCKTPFFGRLRALHAPRCPRREGNSTRGRNPAGNKGKGLFPQVSVRGHAMVRESHSSTPLIRHRPISKGKCYWRDC